MDTTRHSTLKFALLVALIIVSSDMCMEYVEGGINAEIVTSQRGTNCKVDCPRSCQDDNICANCCNCLIGVYGIPVCRKGVCTCLIYPPTSQFNNIPNPLPTISN
ncbi:uncharacterized protein LOC123917496 [Trifolium pratense]|uniref:uncharacterized protein LOC123917496 n=1 Tax=Trifolium pratense TaxID=57577 RepID=UPI001E694418|nr:uncharacterized protein LOC123917496 [Trifolium pratense]